MRRRLAAQSCSFAAHLVTVLALVWGARAVPARPRSGSGQPRRTVAVFVAPPRNASLVPGLNPIDASRADAIRWDGHDSDVAIPGFRFDMRRIAERAMLLFPFLTPGVALDAFGLGRGAGEAIDRTLQFSPEDASRRRAADALRLSDADVQKIVDEAWARRERWSGFQRIVPIVERGNPDEGQLAAVLHGYVVQNALQPFVDTTIPDARLWTELGIAADHVRFIAFISGYAAAHPSTKATTELLFLLDTLVQASADALATLLGADVDRDLRWTRDTNPDAFRLIGDLQRFYRAQLSAKGLTGERWRRSFDAVRMRILTAIVRTTPTGYHAGDARFLLGEILWRNGDAAGAIGAWRAIEDDPGDVHVASYRALREVLHSPARPSIIDGRIADILRSDHARWLMSSMDRLRQFGYRIDTY